MQITIILVSTLFLCSAINAQKTGTVTDIDGNVYQTVKIGEQWWMAENLKVTRYRNSDSIPNVTGDSDWSDLTTGAWANPYLRYNNTYGKLYNWYAVSDERGICPPGWHVPSDEDWMQLEMHLGMTEQEAGRISWPRGTDEGGKLKSTRTEPEQHPRWFSPNTGATNESGFSGLPGGLRGWDGDFYAIGSRGYWWSSTEVDLTTAFLRLLVYDSSNIFKNYYDKRLGFSVRCVSDYSDQSELSITSPTAGETWKVGSKQKITWISSGIEKVNIEYSINGGIIWEPITRYIPALQRSYDWTVPNRPTEQAKVRICEADNTGVCDESGIFSILDDRPYLSISSKFLKFYTVEIGKYKQLILIIKNTGKTDLSGSVKLFEDPSDSFELVQGEAQFILSPDESLEISIRFSPTVSGPLAGKIIIESSVSNAEISLQGRGAETPPNNLVVPTETPPLQELRYFIDEPWELGLLQFSHSQSTIAMFDEPSKKSLNELISTTTEVLNVFNKSFAQYIGKPISHIMIEGGDAVAFAAGWKCSKIVAATNAAISYGLRHIPNESPPLAFDILSTTRDAMEFVVTGGCPVSVVASGVSLIYDKIALPSYETIIEDPPSDDFHNVILPIEAEIPELRNSGLPHRLEELFNQYYNVLFGLYSSLEAIALSTDRLAGAIDAEDAIGASLQIQAILLNLLLHSVDAKKSVNILEMIKKELEEYNNQQQSSGLQGLEINSNILEEVQNFILLNGIPSEAETFLRDKGLNDDDLLKITEDILSMQLPEKKFTDILFDLHTALSEISTRERVSPSNPILISPQNEETNIKVDTTLVWKKMKNTTEYHIQVSTEYDFSSFVVDVSNISDTLLSINDLEFGTTHYWRVRAYNNYGHSDWSNVWKFITIFAKPAVPVLSYPPKDTTGVETALKLQWEATEGVEVYSIQVSADSDFLVLLVDTSGLTATELEIDGLDYATDYYWRVKAKNVGGESEWSHIWKFTTADVTGVISKLGAPTEYKLFQNYPNPFNPSTIIRYDIPERVHTRLSIFNTMGQEIATLVNEIQEAGYHETIFDASHLPSGVYIYRLQAGEYVESRKMLLLK